MNIETQLLDLDHANPRKETLKEESDKFLWLESFHMIDLKV